MTIAITLLNRLSVQYTLPLKYCNANQMNLEFCRVVHIIRELVKYSVFIFSAHHLLYVSMEQFSGFLLVIYFVKYSIS